MDNPVSIARVAISYGSLMDRNGKDGKVYY